MIKLDLSNQEANALLQLIDLAVKSRGLEVAEAGVVLANRIREAAKPQPEPKEAE